MIMSSSVIHLAYQYLTFLKVGYITYEQFFNRMVTLLDVTDYEEVNNEGLRNALRNIQQKGKQYKK